MIHPAYKQLLSEREEKENPKMITIENTTGGRIAETSIPLYDILTIVIGIVAVLLNGLLLIIMLRNKSTIFTSKGAYLIANVAIADLLTGLNSSLWGLRNALRLPQALNQAMISISRSCVEASILTIFVMSLERYIAIVFPFKAQVWLSKTRTILSCVAVWLFSALCGLCIAFSLVIATFCLIVVFEIAILTTMSFYYKVFIKLRQRRAYMSSMQPTVARGISGKAEFKRQYQLTTVVVTITLILIVTVLPYMVGMQIELVRHLFTATNYNRKLELFLNYYFLVELMNFVLNPIVYAWRLPNYRFALLRTLHFH